MASPALSRRHGLFQPDADAIGQASDAVALDCHCPGLPTSSDRGLDAGNGIPDGEGVRIAGMVMDSAAESQGWPAIRPHSAMSNRRP